MTPREPGGTVPTAIAAFRKTRVPDVYIRHRKGCPAEKTDGPRCRCKDLNGKGPTYRAKYRRRWSPSFYDKAEAITWKTDAINGAATQKQRGTRGPTFDALAQQWWEGVQSGAIGKRKGRKGAGYSPTTLAGYKRTLFNHLLPEHGVKLAKTLDEQYWQRWVDELARKGLSRSRIANHLAVVSAIYGWASRATRSIVPRNPTLAVELPPNDERPRERVATAKEAQQLLTTLAPDDQVPYALAFYAGLRRSESHRLDWQDVDLEGLAVTVRAAKSEAGTNRRLPIAEPLRPILRAAFMRQGRPVSGRVTRCAMSGKLAERALTAWGWRRVRDGEVVPASARSWTGEHGDQVWVPSQVPGLGTLEPIGLHECRHTYASILVASKYTLKEVMDWLGHADLTTTSRYVKKLPQPNEENPADRMNRYLEDSG